MKKSQALFKGKMSQALFVFTAAAFFLGLGGGRALAQNEAISQLANTVERSKALRDQLVDYDVVFRRDPMQPLIDADGEMVSVSGLHGGLSVPGIIWSETRPLAVLDDQFLAEGDAIGPYTILDIRKDGLIAMRNREEVFIPLDRGIDAAPSMGGKKTAASEEAETSSQE